MVVTRVANYLTAAKIMMQFRQLDFFSPFSYQDVSAFFSVFTGLFISSEYSVDVAK